MRWSYADYLATPPDVIDVLMDLLEEEAEELKAKRR